MSINVTVPDALAALIKAKVESGQYASPDEVLSQALSLLDERDREESDKLTWLRQAWQEGMESGEPQGLDMQAFKAEARRRLG